MLIVNYFNVSREAELFFIYHLIAVRSSGGATRGLMGPLPPPISPQDEFSISSKIRGEKFEGKEASSKI